MGELRLRIAKFGEGAHAALVEAGALLGEMRAPRGVLEEASAQALLQVGHALARGGRGDAQRAGRGGEAPGFRDAGEDADGGQDLHDPRYSPVRRRTSSPRAESPEEP
ncbi:hypothetical protein HJC10_27980 [Corallococcus exiguus]|nr:hypothetical protein [Corallococcus exiguus]